MRTEGKGPSPLERLEHRYPANAQVVHGWTPVELEKCEGTLRGAVCPRRRTEGVKPDALKGASPVLNGGDEETGLVRPRLVATQLECDTFSSAEISDDAAPLSSCSAA